MIRHLYFHIPFCPKLCPYCCFYVETGGKNKTQSFLDALLREVEVQTAKFPAQPHTIYFGGGTPSALLVPQLDYLLTGLRARLDLGALREWTFEINPATVPPDKARLLRELGVNRISMGVQSWDDAVLKTLGRVHTSAKAERTFGILREAGFDNINLDLMFAVPGQTRAQWRATLDKTIALQPEHISAYCLTYEEDTEYFRKLHAREFTQDTEWDAGLFEEVMDMLPAAGYAHYEISNYARAGYESQHNLACWAGLDYLGFGPSAFSTRGSRRWQNVPDSAAYTTRILAGESPVSFEEKLSRTTKRGERIALSLRTNRGVARAALEPWRGQIAEFASLGMLENIGDRVVLTRKGRLLADTVAEVFV